MKEDRRHFCPSHTDLHLSESVLIAGIALIGFDCFGSSLNYPPKADATIEWA